MTQVSALTIGKAQARRFLLGHQGLLPPRQWAGEQAVLQAVRQLNSIQYDPINVVGPNPHLVLQARIRNYQQDMLETALYKERSLVEGFDKVMCIYPSEDWPYFRLYRETIGSRYASNPEYAEAARLIEGVRKQLETQGPLSSLEMEEDSRVFGGWGTQMRAARVALDMLFFSGEVVVHRRVGSRRYFELSERALGQLHSQPDPHPNLEAYLDWHVLRRIGSLGLARGSGTDHWLSMLKAPGGRPAALKRLLAAGAIHKLQISEWPEQAFYIRSQDLAAMQNAEAAAGSRPAAAFIAPLDNAIWDRSLLEKVFDFYYRWEVYVPAAKRQYAYYVLPVLFGERFVARLDPAFERSSQTFVIQNWWWEAGVDKKDPALVEALGDCIREFARYLGAENVRLAEPIQKDAVLRQALKSAGYSGG